MKKKLQSIVLAFMMALTVAVAPVGGVITGNGNVAVIEEKKKKTIKHLLSIVYTTVIEKLQEKV